MDPDASVKKPFRARKTMTVSSRKQIEILRNIQARGKTGSVTNRVDNCMQLKMIERDCLNRSPCKETNADLELKQTSAKEPVAKRAVNSESRIYDGSPDVSRGSPYNGCSAHADVEKFLNPGCFEDLLYSLYKKDSSSPVSKPAELRLYSEPTSRPLDTPKELTSSVASSTSGVPTMGKTVKTEGMPENLATPVLEQQRDSFQFREGNTLSDDPLRKRRPSEHKEVTSKRRKWSRETKTSGVHSNKNQPGLEMVRGFIQSHLDSKLGDLDRKVQQLSKRIDRMQCLQNHEQITVQMTKRISRLNRRVDSVAEFQKAQLPQKANLPSAEAKINILNAPKPLPDCPNDPPASLKRRSAEAPSKTTRSSDKETCLHGETSGVQSVNSADVQQKKASSNSYPSTEVPHAAQNSFLIDLTEEENAKPEEAVSVKANPPPESTTARPHQPAPELSKKIPVPFSHLPPLPTSHQWSQHLNGFEDTLPPQRLQLAVAQIQNPKGIGLQWNIRQVDPRCAPIESFHLYICVENTKAGTVSAWTKTNVIKALPLPLACSMSFPASGKCYFAMQSKDVYGRFGPFCDIQSISAV
ncbi:activating transcription factor 7-interacting protein 2 isoform X1 [Sphaerodactylus townsendi]|uniref:activating transcription factor 7-interacting protein 2 isoform X1 n=1 Tax=Sphaerodactylus townsendi TaxID=933632 RepID=UPI002026DE2A|nr:activating transcription factor 7-interacting protein 2 isoform X1 [Sphaerodactylus townsendi]XP_048350700.1 activating transcription factor 7-interacting protein 2 isoform X1 [Sphaerodactylus townsendi]